MSSTGGIGPNPYYTNPGELTKSINGLKPGVAPKAHPHDRARL